MSWRSGPTSRGLQAFQHELLTAPLVPAWSFVSLTEVSEYTSTEDDERARLEREEGLSGSELADRARGVARAHGALPREPAAPAAAREAAARLLPDVEAPGRGRELVRAAVRANARSSWPATPASAARTPVASSN